MKSVIDEYLHLDPLRTRISLHQHYSEPAIDIEADVAAVVGIASGDDLLDVGSGTGSFLQRLSELHHAGRLCAADTSTAAIEAVSAIPGVEAVVADAVKLPYTDSPHPSRPTTSSTPTTFQTSSRMSSVGSR